MAKVCLLAWCKYLMLLPWAAAAAAAGEESLLAAGLQLLVLSSAVKRSIGFTIGFHNHREGPYWGLLLVESAY